MSIQSYANIDSPNPVNLPDLANKGYVDSRRTYAIKYIRSAAFTFSATANTMVTPFIFDAKSALQTGVWDPDTNYNTSTGYYTCPADGIYLVEARIGINATASGQSVNCQITQNGTVVVPHSAYTSQAAAGAFGCQTTGLLLAFAGDTISIQAITSLASGTIRNNVETHLAVARLGGL